MRTVYATPRRESRDPPIPQRTESIPANPTPPPVSSAFALPPVAWTETPIPLGLLPCGLTNRLLSSLENARCVGYTGLVEEIRLRAGRKATLTIGGQNYPTDLILRADTLADLLVHLCGGSLYAYSDTIHHGYMTLPGGIRVGIAGRAVCEEGHVIGVTDVTSLCIRLPHPYRAVGGTVCRLLRHLSARGQAQGVLIYAPPGVGKTTLLRAVAATMASGTTPWRTVVVDTRGELGFECDRPDLCLDILHGYPRARGVEIATRTLSAELIVCDEIGDVDEAMSLISAHHGGVPLVASAHAGTVEELLRRTGIRLLHEARLFGAYVGIRRSGDGWEASPRSAPAALRLGQERDSVAAPSPHRRSDAWNRPDDQDKMTKTGEKLNFYRNGDRGITVAQPCATVGQKPHFRPQSAQSVQNCVFDATDDYLYRITPWTDADRLTGGG